MPDDTGESDLTQTTVRIREDQQDWLNQHDVVTLSSIVRKQIDELMEADGIVATVDPDDFEFDTQSSQTPAGDDS